MDAATLKLFQQRASLYVRIRYWKKRLQEPNPPLKAAQMVETLSLDLLAIKQQIGTIPRKERKQPPPKQKPGRPPKLPKQPIFYDPAQPQEPWNPVMEFSFTREE